MIGNHPIRAPLTLSLTRNTADRPLSCTSCPVWGSTIEGNFLYKNIKLSEQIFKKILNVDLKLKPISITHEQAENLRLQFASEEPVLPEADIDEIAKSFGGKIIE